MVASWADELQRQADKGEGVGATVLKQLPTAVPSAAEPAQPTEQEAGGTLPPAPLSDAVRSLLSKLDDTGTPLTLPGAERRGRPARLPWRGPR